jgi:glycine/D-amino acid oxidase-like deaminating enzyme
MEKQSDSDFLGIEYRKQGFWLDSMPGTLRARGPLPGDADFDVAIVGAGYTGLWTAYYLNQIEPKLQIAILEAEIAGYGASGRNGGWCSGFLSGIEGWLDDPAQSEDAIRLQRLMFDAVAEVGRVSQRESIECHFEQSGALQVAVLPVQLERLRQELAYQSSLGFGDQDYRWLDTEASRGVLDIDKTLGGLLMRHCASIHPARLARGLADTLEKQGIAIYEHTPVREVSKGRLHTPGGRVRADTIVLATEGYTGSLAGHGRRLIPLHSMMVVTEPLSASQMAEAGFQSRITFGNLDRIVTYGQFTADNRIAIGCRGSYRYGSKIHQFDDADPEFELVRQTLLRFFPSLQGISFTHAWGGAMGVSRALQPSVAHDPGQGLAWAGGYFGNGVGASNLAGRTLADLILKRDTERLHTPWVNAAGRRRKWEPEPLRWAGISARRHLMQLADRAEYRGSVFAPAVSKTLEAVFP